MAIHPRLGRCRLLGPHVTGIPVRRVKGEDLSLLLDTADHHSRAKIGLYVAGRMRCRSCHKGQFGRHTFCATE